ncbi:MAG: NUDIX hydrolase [Patescibacteria group bacterium]|nr:NUDIX hydrolase [Patescibacteria group bacterium]
MPEGISHDSETPAQGQQVITACAFIHYSFGGVEKVFLPKRAHTKKFLPGIYELPGGHINFGEDIVAGLKREIMEEFGMHIGVGDPFAVFTYTNEIKGSHSIEVVYFATFEDPIENIRINPQDHSEYRWVAEREAPSLFASASDEELANVKKGFALLRGETHSFGYM